METISISRESASALYEATKNLHMGDFARDQWAVSSALQELADALRSDPRGECVGQLTLF